MTGTPPVSDRRLAQREAVLRAAADLFNERGFSGTALDDVAARLGVTKPIIYRHFANKDEILFECARRGLEQILAASAGARDAQGRARKRLEALAERYALIMTGPFGMCVIRTGDQELSPASRAKVRAMKREVGLAVRALIEAGQADGSIGAGDPKLMSLAIAGALNWIATWYDPAGPLPREALAAEMAALALRMAASHMT